MKNLSLFSGSGIGDYAAEQCGIETVAQCEIDSACMYCLERLFPNAKKFKDVHDVSAESLRGIGPIDIISGGFPCQNLSTAGRGEGIEGSRSGLWKEMFRVIRQVRPTWCVIENVPIIRVRGVDRVIAPLERIGYTCWPLVVGAWSVGAPHKRDRVWIVGRLANPSIDADGDATEKTAKHRRVGTEDRASDVSQGGKWGTHQPNAIAGNADSSNGLDGAASTRRPGTIGCEPCRQIWNETRREESLGRCGGNVADAEGTKCSGDWPQSNGQQDRLANIRWPSRPGQPQHDWEAPRLAQFGVGDATHGMAGRVRSRANKALLRMVGNGWCYPIPYLIYQWIMETERTKEPKR